MKFDYQMTSVDPEAAANVWFYGTLIQWVAWSFAFVYGALILAVVISNYDSNERDKNINRSSVIQFVDEQSKLPRKTK